MATQTVKELRKTAKNLGYKGYSSMKKKELLSLLNSGGITTTPVKVQVSNGEIRFIPAFSTDREANQYLRGLNKSDRRKARKALRENALARLAKLGVSDW